jgi:Spy/CpxP family protein refolding chaperone
MIVKDSQLHQTEWPIVLTPEQREQLIKEKIARLATWHRRQQTNDLKDCERS